MKAFVNSVYNKEQAVALAQMHQDSDDFVSGTYGEGDYTQAGFKGCSVGCMAGGKHEDFVRLYGLPPQVAYLADSIFELLPEPDQSMFTLQLFQAPREGADVSRVWDKFAAWMLGDPVDGLAADPHCLSCVRLMAQLFERAAKGDEPTQKEWDDAALAAWAARSAWAARAASLAMEAWAARAARSAIAAIAARSARSAWSAWSAWSARSARSARSAIAARSARSAWSASAEKSRDKLFQILSECAS